MEYIACIDGGATKTELTVLDNQGKIVYGPVQGGPGNILEVGEAALQETLSSLFQQALSGGVSLNGAKVYAGFAGIGRKAEQIVVEEIFRNLGFVDERMTVKNDGAALLELVGDTGLVVISGTGSIVLGKKGAQDYRVGGLGHVLGDEGSGYAIGLAAIKAATEQAQGYGEDTALTERIRQHFDKDNVLELISDVTKGSIKKPQIAAVSPIVFELAAKGDVIARKIIEQAGDDLAQQIAQMKKLMEVDDCPVILVGGTFKGEHAGMVLDKLRSGSSDLRNMSNENLMAEAARQTLRTSTR